MANIIHQRRLEQHTCTGPESARLCRECRASNTPHYEEPGAEALYEARVRELEAEGMTTSDAQAVADADEYLPNGMPLSGRPLDEFGR